MKQVILIIILAAIYSNSAISQTATGLVASYSFNDGTGTDGVGVNHAIIKNAVSTADRFGNSGQAMLLDGKLGTYINLGASTTLKPQEGSISLWVLFNQISYEGNGYLYNPIFLAKNKNILFNNEAYSLYVDMQTQQLVSITASDNEFQKIQSPSAIPKAKWQHIVLTYNATNITLFMNGVQITTATKSFTTVFAPFEDILIGNNNTTLIKGNNRAFNGAVDDIRIYDRVLAVHEIANLTNEANPAGPPPPPIGTADCKQAWLLQPNSALTLNPDGTIFKSNQGGGSSTAILENKLEAEDDGWISFQINSFGTKPNGSAGKVQIKAEIGLISYEFSLDPSAKNNKQTVTITNTTDGVNSNVSTINFVAVVQNEDLFKLERLGNEFILYKSNNGSFLPIVTVPNIANGQITFSIHLQMPGASIRPMDISDNFPCPPYAELKQKLDGGFVQQTDNILRIKFIQEYAVNPTTQYEDVHYDIYDWNRGIPQSGTMRIYYGINWKSIQLNGLSASTHYTLEFTANKGEKYLLRFKTKP